MWPHKPAIPDVSSLLALINRDLLGTLYIPKLNQNNCGSDLMRFIITNTQLVYWCTYHVSNVDLSLVCRVQANTWVDISQRQSHECLRQTLHAVSVDCVTQSVDQTHVAILKKKHKCPDPRTIRYKAQFCVRRREETRTKVQVVWVFRGFKCSRLPCW